MTREEARERTRGALLDAAEEVFAEKGFTAATLDEIAERAERTRGAVYHHFEGKDELFVAALERRMKHSIAAIQHLFEETDDPAGFFEALRSRADVRRDEIELRKWTLLETEYWLYACRNREARPLLAEHYRHLRSAYGAAVTTTLERAGVEPPMPVERIAAVVFALDDGLPRQWGIDPDAVPENLFLDTMALLLQAAQALQASTAPPQRPRTPAHAANRSPDAQKGPAGG